MNKWLISLACMALASSAYAACPSTPPPYSLHTLMGTESSDAVTIVGGCLDNVVIGSNTAGPATFTTLSVPFADVTLAPTNQTGISGATSAAVMLGLAKAASNPALMTPVAGSDVFLMITGSVVVGTSGDGVLLQASYGTGVLPANNGTLAGTQLGAPVKFVNASSTTETVPFTVAGVVPLPTLNTQLWFDLAVQNVTGGTATITNVTVTAHEF